MCLSPDQVFRGIEFGVVPDQRFPIRGQVVPGSCHLQKLIAMLALGHLLGEHSAFFSVFSVFGCGFHD
ncbi:hypothetical protein BB934_42460 (plasmid) [Microvirga ossetica]|uniref:Uncharacterized protein n=1 Tax=Microvirga ossetica TaxID=1882682 RepID=A0A1B2EY63_9HYPH|nr:hypothetical protein BB934_42460 [Microvirga ossetica]